MVLLIFFIISAAASVLYAVLSDGVSGIADIWKPLLLCLGGVVGLVIVYLLIAAVVSLFIDRSRPIRRKLGICRLFCYMAGSIVCSVTRIRPHLSGLEKIPTDRRFLLVCNHRSGYDPMFMLANLWKYDMAFVSKPSNIAIPVIGHIAYGAGCLIINRENNREALKTIITASEYMLKDMCSMCIFPEGTRSKTGELGPFHAGSFKIAQKAKSPVVVASIRGTESVKKGFLKGRSDVYLDILDVIPEEKVCSSKTAELAEYSRNLILGSLGH
ncbi:MAG: 1-acyl-sn-glycerol-3-phosphate acyltransferase [Oscillospiraceae bacterium]|nr:1-acyl-sn-glycerol-3-phosphate acyltransferase [Oscillospiraceae bacterium]